MTKHDPRLDRLFHALSDPTRRGIVERLAHGPATVSELAEPTGMALPTVMRHIAVLAEGDLVQLMMRRPRPEPADATKTYDSYWFDLFRVKDGKIVEHWDSALKPVK